MSLLPSIRFEATGSEYIARVFQDLARELRTSDAFLERVADEVLAEEAELSIERGRRIPLAQATLERRRRPKQGRWHHSGPKDSTEPLPANTGVSGWGMVAALTAPYQNKIPVALREVEGDTLYWGSKRWVSQWIGYHMQAVAPTRHMPARIDFMTGESAAEVSRRIRSTWSSHLFERLEAAGAPEEWLAASESEEFGF